MLNEFLLLLLPKTEANDKKKNLLYAENERHKKWSTQLCNG